MVSRPGSSAHFGTENYVSGSFAAGKTARGHSSPRPPLHITVVRGTTSPDRETVALSPRGPRLRGSFQSLKSNLVKGLRRSRETLRVSPTEDPVNGGQTRAKRQDLNKATTEPFVKRSQAKETRNSRIEERRNTYSEAMLKKQKRQQWRAGRARSESDRGKLQKMTKESRSSNHHTVNRDKELPKPPPGEQLPSTPDNQRMAEVQEILREREQANHRGLRKRSSLADMMPSGCTAKVRINDGNAFSQQSPRAGNMSPGGRDNSSLFSNDDARSITDFFEYDDRGNMDQYWLRKTQRPVTISHTPSGFGSCSGGHYGPPTPNTALQRLNRRAQSNEENTLPVASPDSSGVGEANVNHQRLRDSKGSGKSTKSRFSFEKLNKFTQSLTGKKKN